MHKPVKLLSQENSHSHYLVDCLLTVESELIQLEPFQCCLLRFIRPNFCWRPSTSLHKRYFYTQIQILNSAYLCGTNNFLFELH